ncbi:MAG TPA: acetolactate synthase small subunit [Ktedonobacter sp.]|jgi:acetolactate synthase-1/3 small subunit|nr:acetolactate synthase small subunit [Ktedonobacter sp.]HAG98041.1 acetolactate synthase small subunit [Ktedonobacter sp.]HAT44575.1 acetolactate synthase small subunit [Ktedonobacter sp.]HBE25289.1 acetolactate synthase small subunit [Ktedonobacter sp.]HCF86352.1 acetolactate synthase small subunit [Ktedonobacter sp.]
MTKHVAPPKRAGQENAPQDGGHTHILVLFVDDSHGALDRIIGLLRRRRSNMQTFAIGRSEMPNVVRITVVVNDSEVGVEQLVEQLRKIVDVRHIVNLSFEQAVARELALIKVNSTAAHQNEIIELGHLFGAHAADVDHETVTLEVTGSADKIDKLVTLLQAHGIREVARTGCVAMTRGTANT